MRCRPTELRRAPVQGAFIRYHEARLLLLPPSEMLGRRFLGSPSVCNQAREAKAMAERAVAEIPA